MKRSPELAPLSREHNTALKLARDARRAATDGHDRDVAAAWRALCRCWYTEMGAHFRAEETLLFPILRQHGATELLLQLHREHQAMRTVLEDPGRQDRQRLGILGEVLRDHVRREEREVFPFVESVLDRPAAARLKASMDRMLTTIPEPA